MIAQRLLLGLSVFFICVGVHSVHAQEQEIRELLEMSGLTTQIQHIPGMIQSGLTEQEKNSSNLTSGDFKKLKEIMADAYQFRELYRSVFSHFNSNYHPRRFQAMLDMLRSPLAKKMTRLEGEASSPEGYQGIQSFSNSLETDPPTRDRMQLVIRLDQVSGATELSVELQVLTVMMMVKAFNAASPPQERVSEADIEATYQNMRAKFTKTLQTVTAVTLLYTYRSVTDEELENYIRLYETGEGRLLTRLTHEALKDAMSEAAKKVGKKVAEELRQKSI